MKTTIKEKVKGVNVNSGTCKRCGAIIDNPYLVNGDYYGSTCYKIILREIGIPSGMKESDWDVATIIEAIELAKSRGNKYDIGQRRRELVSMKAWKVIYPVSRGYRLRVGEKMIDYYNHVRAVFRSLSA